MKIMFETSLGNFSVALDMEAVPLTCENFLSYVRSGFYDGTLFHRVIRNFVAQGGGFDLEMQQKQTEQPVENEAHQAASNAFGTLAMARTDDPHSATAQFFINLRDNDHLDFRAKNRDQWGYCVFGKVIDGIEVIEKIAEVETGSHGGHQDVPLEPVVIHKVYVAGEAE